MDKWGWILVVGCGLLLAACGGKDKAGAADTRGGLPDETEALADSHGTPESTSPDADLTTVGEAFEHRADQESAVSGQLGEECSAHAECLEGVGLCLELLPGTQVCTGDCVIFGDCPAGWECLFLPEVEWPVCVPEGYRTPCESDCDGRECGDDGCGGSCGECPCQSCSPMASECTEGVCSLPCADCDCNCHLLCALTCGDQPTDECLSSCGIASGPLDYGWEWSTWGFCMAQHGLWECDAGDQECVDAAFDACWAQICTCNSGDKDCAELYECLVDCEEYDCVSACYYTSTDEANETWGAFIDCLESVGYFECPEGDDPCLEQAEANCAGEFNACLGCNPNCTGNECGDDGCGGSCGDCEGPKMECVDGECQVVCDCLDDADCQPAEDFDLCNGMLVCGLTAPCMCELDPDSVVACPEGQVCVPMTGMCCLSDCAGKECGDDGCGGSCGDCPNGEACSEQNMCVSGTWYDETTGLMWQNPPVEEKESWNGAKGYCNSLELGGYQDWHLPTIGELRTLIRSCPATEGGGSCNIEEGDCLAHSCMNESCYGCTSDGGPGVEGMYWSSQILGACCWYWSSSMVEDADGGGAWGVYFDKAWVNFRYVLNETQFRCVR